LNDVYIEYINQYKHHSIVYYIHCETFNMFMFRRLYGSKLLYVFFT